MKGICWGEKQPDSLKCVLFIKSDRLYCMYAHITYDFDLVSFNAKRYIYSKGNDNIVSITTVMSPSEFNVSKDVHNLKHFSYSCAICAIPFPD